MTWVDSLAVHKVVVFMRICKRVHALVIELYEPVDLACLARCRVDGPNSVATASNEDVNVNPSPFRLVSLRPRTVWDRPVAFLVVALLATQSRRHIYLLRSAGYQPDSRITAKQLRSRTKDLSQT